MSKLSGVSTSELKRREKAGNAARGELSRRNDAAAESANRKLIDKCFKYRNTFGGPDCNGWWLYRRVLDVRDDRLVTFEFQVRGDARIEVTLEEYAFAHGEGWQQISEGEFDAAYKKLHETMARFQEGNK